MRSYLLYILILFFVACSSHQQEDAELQLTIIHMNDIHSHLESEKNTFTLYLEDNTTLSNITMDVGGMARAVSQIKQLQNLYPNNLTLFGGDLIQGTLYFTLFEGNATLAMYNQIEWNGFEVGNHEWDEGDTFLNSLLNKIKTGVILAANIKPDGITMDVNRFQPYFIQEIDGKEVGVIGIDVVQKTEVSSDPSEHITFLPEKETAQKYIDELLGKGVDKIVLLTHIGYDNDLSFAKELHGVDVIIGGDSHTLMGDFSSIGLQSNINEYPKIVHNADGKNVCIAQAWSYSRVVGKLHIDFNDNGDVVKCFGDAILGVGEPFEQNGEVVDDTTYDKIINFINNQSNIALLQKDTQTLQTLQPYKEEISQQEQEVIAYAKEYISNNRIPYSDYDGHGALPHGSQLAPLVCKGFLEADKHGDICIQNAGGVRISLEEGNITIKTVYDILPFKNTLYELTMDASEIKQTLEDGLNNYLDDGGSTGSFPYAYNLRYDINTSQTRNNRVSHIEYRNKETLEWQPLDANKSYIVITHSYLASGHDGYTTFANVSQINGVNTYIDYAMSFVKYLELETQKGNQIETLPLEELPVQCFIDATHTQCP